MEYLLLCLSVIMLTLYNLFSDIFSRRIIQTQSDFFTFNTGMSAVASVVFLVLALIEGSCSLYTLIVGLVFAVVTLAAQFATIQAMRYGSMANTAMFNSCGMLIPTIAGFIFWREKASWIQIIGVVIIIVSFVIGADLKTREKMKIKWFGYALLLFVCAGLTGVIQKVHQTSEYKNERFSLLFVAFIVMGITSLIMMFINRRKDNAAGTKAARLTPKYIILFLLTGVCMSFVHPANLYLSGVLPGVCFFPIINGSPIILCGVLSVFIMKEKISHTQFISFVIGTVGIIVLSLG
ncbi:MAG: hypothetical protein E7385_06455 [Ruminococcaceae bacterium]|nr:hypothetical protein [Oscillospiraceae bacterium]